jgi:uncharacterized UPF0160 family protein
MKALTHNGPMHADDVYSAALLELTAEAPITVERNAGNDLSGYDVVFDVGGVYDPGKGLYDHHQGGEALMRPDGVQRSAFGLLWLDYGERLCRRFGVSNAEEIADCLDGAFVRFIDLVDTSARFPFSAGKKEYVYFLQSMIDEFNATGAEIAADKGAQDALFRQAVEIAKLHLVRLVKRTANVLEGHTAVDKAFRGCRNGVMVLPQFAPWTSRLLRIDTGKKVFAVVYPSLRGGYAVQAVPNSPSDRNAGNRCRLLSEEEYRKRGLSTTFVHHGRWIGAAETEADAIEMARLAVGKGPEPVAEKAPGLWTRALNALGLGKRVISHKR